MLIKGNVMQEAWGENLPTLWFLYIKFKVGKNLI